MSAARTLLVALLLSGTAEAADCSYRIWRWDTALKQSVDHRTVQTSRASLPPEAIDSATGCSLCEQDQRWVRIEGLPPVQLCARIADSVEAAMRRAVAEGARITTLVGYRPGYTRGALDDAGRRTGLSNHSFGISLDVDAEFNGLYDQCSTFGPTCRLLRGGPWSAAHPQSLHPGHPVVRALTAAGLRWGGRLPGRQKDFMHFSPRGD